MTNIILAIIVGIIIYLLIRRLLPWRRKNQKKARRG